MTKIDIGFEIKLEKLIETRALIQANSGGGKSYLLRKFIEQVHGKAPYIILDLEGEFITIREKYDVIVFGQGHDIPINIQYADKLARYLLELSANAIIDLSELKHHERILFVKRFLESMISAPRALWHPTIVVLDEAHQFCPEDSKAESASAVIDLCTRGRKRGYCAVLATQRLSKLNKDAAAELNNKLIGRTTLDVDVKRTASELGMNPKDAKQQLRQLDEGEFYVFGPAISNEVTKQKVSRVSTTHVKTGMKFSKITPPSKTLQKIIGKISEIPAEVEEEKDIILSLRSRIKELEANNKPMPVSVDHSKFVIQLKKELAIHQSLLKQYENKFKAISSNVQNIRKNTDRAYESVLHMIQEEKIKSPDSIFLGPHSRIELTLPVITKPSKSFIEDKFSNKDQIDSTGTKLGKCERAILIVLAQTGKACDKNFIAIRSGYSVGGNFKNCLGKLRTLEFIKGYGDSEITPAGLKALGVYHPLPAPGPELQQFWINELGKCEGLILQHLINIYPQAADKESIANSIGYDVGGNFKNCLGKLRTLQLIEGRGETKASSSLFE